MIVQKRRKSKARQGCLITNDVILEKHEMATVNFLLDYGKNIELIRPSSVLYSKKADLIMDGLIWEMKSPCGRGKYVIRDTIRAAVQQSPNIILDLRRIKLEKEKAHRIAQKCFNQTKTAKRLLVIVDNQLFDYTKKM